MFVHYYPHHHRRPLHTHCRGHRYHRHRRCLCRACYRLRIMTYYWKGYLGTGLG